MSTKRSKKNKIEARSEKMFRRSTGLTRDHFQGPNSRSFPGLPPKERKGFAYYMPLDDLSTTQRLAAETLFGIGPEKEQDWEAIMPRRSYGSNATYVLVFQKKTWSHLSEEEQTAAKRLNISEHFWNQQLTPFHDDLWSIPGVTLSQKEFVPVLAAIRKMSQSSILTKKKLAHFLLSLEKLLLPSQGAAIAAALKRSPSWESLLESAHDDMAQYNSRFHVHLVIASFLSDPNRFVGLPYQQTNVFWDDDSFGCVWGNAGGRVDQFTKRKSYAVALTELIARRTVAPILVRAGIMARTKDDIPLPPLPKHVVKYLLDEILGIPAASIDPFQVSWLFGYDVPLTVLLVEEGHTYSARGKRV